jgi:hypothetical protein
MDLAENSNKQTPLFTFSEGKQSIDVNDNFSLHFISSNANAGTKDVARIIIRQHNF